MSLRYLLDTDTCIYYLNGLESVVDAVNRIDQDSLALSQISLAELHFGAFNSEQVERNLSRVDFLESSISVLLLDSATTREYARLKAKLRKAGIKIDDFDLFIAATALVNDLTLVTNNLKHFERIEGLRIENWSRTVNQKS